MRAWRVAAAVVLLAMPLPRSDPPDRPPRNPPNVVLIVTDDQRFDSLFSMPHVVALAAHGITFSRGDRPQTPVLSIPRVHPHRRLFAHHARLHEPLRTVEPVRRMASVPGGG